MLLGVPASRHEALDYRWWAAVMGNSSTEEEANRVGKRSFKLKSGPRQCKITMTNVCFAEAIKLGHGNGESIGQSRWSCPYNGNHFSFQRMDDKVKDD